MDRFTLCALLLTVLRTGLSCRRYVPDVDDEEIDNQRGIVSSQDLPFYMDREVTNYTKNQRNIEKGCRCGKPNRPNIETTPRILGGTDALRHEFPWQVALALLNTRVSVCGGTLINSHFVLTAAHCVIDTSGGVAYYAINKLKDIQILLNAHDLNIPADVREALNEGKRKKPSEVAAQDAKDKVMRINVAEVFVHPGYTYSLVEYQSKQIEDDIALIRLARPVVLTNPGGPYTSCLPDTDNYELFPNMKGLIIGWGRTVRGVLESLAPSLQKLEIPINPLKDCRSRLSQFRISFHFICIGTGTRDHDAGVGDSGGPLMVLQGVNTTKEHYIQVGLSSFQNSLNPDDTSTAYSVYSRVAEFLPWIYSHTEKIKDVKWCQRTY